MNRLFEEENWNYRVLVIPIGLFFIAFLTWASVSEIDEVVRGEGKVIPSGQKKVLQHLEGGIVSDILVKEGDKVKKNQMIYKLSQALFRADLKSKQMELDSLQANIIRLKAQIEGKEKVAFPKRMRKAIPDIVENETKIFEEDLQNNKRKVKIAIDKVKQKKLKLTEQEIKFDNLSIELRLAMDNMEILEKLLKKKVVSKKEYISELAKKQNVVTKIEEVRNSLPVLKEEIQEAKKRVNAEKSKIRSKFLSDYSKIKTEVNKLLEKSKADIDRDIRKAVVSPVKGVVNKLYFNTVGGIIKSGDKIAEITPADESLMIEAKIKTSDRALIWTGQKVSIEITAYDSSKYGMLEGTLVLIASDSTTDDKGSVFYEIKVEATDFEFAPDLPILPGMVANVNILSGKKTIMQYILKPLKDISRKSLTER